MKILITGGSGLLGQYLNVMLSKSNQILTQYNSNHGNCLYFPHVNLDVSDQNSLTKVFGEFEPDVVVHAAAISNPLSAQNIDSKIVYAINVTATENIAKLCNKHKAKLIYTSTDLVYAGYRGSMLKEDAKLIPASLYAETKLMGEVKIKETFDNYIILRTALLYGLSLNHSRNHFHNMYPKLKEGKEVKLFTDQYRTPLSLFDAAKMISDLIYKNIKSEIINFGGLKRVSRYQLGEILCDIAGLNKNLLVKIKMDDVPDLVKVEDVSMNTDKLQALGLQSRSIADNIIEFLQ